MSMMGGMVWERVMLQMKAKEVLEGKKSPGRKGGIMGPGRRWGHTCNSVKNGRFLYVFGGYGKDNCQTNDVHVFDAINKKWSKPMVKGIAPSPRDSHSCTAVGTDLFVFGGTDGKNPLSDLHILDTSSNTWSQPRVTGEGPSAREGHSATLVNQSLYIFGGCGKTEDDEEIYHNDLYILDTGTYQWTKANTSGIPPTARDSHTCSTWGNKIVIVAGEDASDSYLSDVHILDPGTLEWKELVTSGQVLEPRAGHSAVALGKHLFVFGGFTDSRSLYNDIRVLNLETGVWIKAEASGDIPSARFSVAGDCLDTRKGILAFIGGCNEQLEALDDMYYLHTEISIENGQDEQKTEKLSLRKELKRKRLEHQVSLNDSEKEKDIFKPENLKQSPSENFTIPEFSVANAGPSNSLYNFKPKEERIFEARITDVFHYGYTLVSNIDGKPMRGLIFSNKPGFAHAVQEYLKRKEASEANMHPSHDTQKQATRRLKQVVKRANVGQPTSVISDTTTRYPETMEPTSSSNPPAIDAEPISQFPVTEQLFPPKNPSVTSPEMYQKQPPSVQYDTNHHESPACPVTYSTTRPISSPASNQGVYAVQTHPQPSNEVHAVPSHANDPHIPEKQTTSAN